jgi:HD-GYP domain-containing protein (c-di-GMP phosphodiesterase class II)
MKRLRLADLETAVRLNVPLLHPSGETLVEAGSVLTSAAVRLMAQAGIEEVLRREPGEDLGELVLAARHRVMRLKELRIGQRLDGPLFDESGKPLAKSDMLVSHGMLSSLRRRGVRRVCIRRSPEELKLDQVEAFRRAMQKLNRARPAAFQEQFEAPRQINAGDCTPRRMDEILGFREAAAVPRRGQPLAEDLRDHDVRKPRPALAREGCLASYEETLGQATATFRAFGLKKDVAPEEVEEPVRRMVGALIADRNLLLAMQGAMTGSDYLAGHSVGVTVLAVAVASARGWSRGAVLEMGSAAYLHDIGMLRLPPGMVNCARKLSPMELKLVRQHPALSLDMIQPLAGRQCGLAESIPAAVYQSHEREDASGYPRGCPGVVINEFAKILAVCDVYQAMVSRRPWREGLLPCRAMEQMLIMGSRRQLDPEAVRSLLQCLSLFPVGSWVELADGSRGRVVAPGEGDVARPRVSVLYSGSQRLERPAPVDLVERRDLGVVRPIPAPKEASDVMEGF